MLSVPLIAHTLSLSSISEYSKMKGQCFSRCLRGLAPEKTKFKERCFYCLIILMINSITSRLTTHLACCGKYVHDRCQKRWERVNNTCANCKQPRVQEKPIEERSVVRNDAIEGEPQRLVALEALRLYRANNEEIRSCMNVSACFVNHASMQ